MSEDFVKLLKGKMSGINRLLANFHAHRGAISKQKGVTMTIQEGKTAPAFTLPDQNGNKVALKDFKGKNVILFFYPKDNTSG